MGTWAHWCLWLQDVYFNIVNKPGVQDQVPDAHSWNPLPNSSGTLDVLPDSGIIAGLDLQIQLDDAEAGALLCRLETTRLMRETIISKAVTQSKMDNTVLRRVDSCQTYTDFFWPKMRGDVRTAASLPNHPSRNQQVLWSLCNEPWEYVWSISYNPMKCFCMINVNTHTSNLGVCLCVSL